MAICRFQLLGSLKITFDNEDWTGLIPGKKARLLLAYLVLAWDMPQMRKQIAFDLWPDSTEKQALSNLRKLLHDLRECLPRVDAYLKVTPAYMFWNTELPCCSDVREFEQAAQGNNLFELKTAEELYRGELLPGFYEEWLQPRREWLAQIYLNVLMKLVSLLENQREYTSALFYANKLLIQNKLSEETYRTLMRLHALKNDIAGVQLLYEQLRSVLQTELGIAPAEETRQLYEQLTQHKPGHPTPVHHSSVFIGRMAEWERMMKVWRETAASGASLLVLQGEAGIGKTRLALEFKEWAESQGIQTAFAGCYRLLNALSYTPLTSWLRSFPLPELKPVWLTELARLLPEVLERYPDLPEPALIRESWQLYRWYEAIERMLLSRQPLLFILDDMQWCDKETLQLLSYILRRDSQIRLLVVATMRTDEHPDDAVGTFLAGLRAERKSAEIKLESFSGEHTKQLMAAIVGDKLADLHSSGLHTESGGNPLFIMETIRDWQTGSGKNGFRLSPMVKAAIENRLGRLQPELIRLVSATAAVGRPVSAAFMAAVMDMREEAVFESMEKLQQLMIMQEDGQGFYEFPHELVRKTAYGLNSGSRRRHCHRQIASSLIAGHSQQPEAAAAEIAFHFELAGMTGEAVFYYEKAAAAAEKIYAHESGIQNYRKLCQLMPPEQILPILMKLGNALIIAGDWKEAVKTFRQWLERSGNRATIRERSLCDVALGNCLRLQGEYEEAGFHLERALRYFELTDDHPGLGSVYAMLATLHYYRGDYDRVHSYLQRRNELPPGRDQTQEDCRFYGLIGHLFYDQGEYGEAIYWIRKQIETASENEDKYTIEQAMGVLAMIYMDMDEMDRARGLLADKMEISQAIGDRMGFAIARGMLGRLYGYLGDYAQASPHIVFCLEEAALIKDWRAAAIMLSYEGRNLLALQRYKEAGLLLDRSIRLFNQLSTPYFACETLYFISLLKQSQHRYEQAVESAEEALEIANRLKRRDMQVSLLVLLLMLQMDLGWLSPAEAENRLQGLLEQYSAQQEQAAIRFALWKLQPESAELRTAALLLNEELYRKAGKQQYLHRCMELGAESCLTGARPAAELSKADSYTSLSPKLLEHIDQYLNRQQ